MKLFSTLGNTRRILMPCALSLLLLSGCSQLGGINGASQQNTAASVKISETSQSSVMSQAEGTNEDFLKLGITGKTVIDNLGEAETKSDTQKWEADGLEHQTWIYASKGIEFDMVNSDNGQAVNMIAITDPSNYKTDKGICIGSLYEDVLEAYKENIDQNELKSDKSEIIAGSVYDGIIFTFENNKVSRIFIGAAAE